MTNAQARLALLMLTALALAALAPRAAAQGPAPKEAPAAVEGRVTDGDEGLAGVSVVLVSFQNPGRLRSVARAKTDQEGRYRLSGVAPGRYHVLPAAPSYVMQEHFQGYPPGRPLVLSAGETVRDMDFRLTRGGVITGRVTDADGQPVIAETVHVTSADPARDPRQNFLLQQQRIATDDRGVYRAYGLPAGRYRVSVGQDATAGLLSFGARRFYRRTFHPDAVEESQARAVEVAAGAEAADVDITVARPARTFSASGRFVGTDGRPAQGVTLAVGPVDRGGGGVVGAYGGGWTTNARGEFRVEGLGPGRYAVFAMPAREETPEDYSEPAEFTVTDADVSGLEVRLRRGASLSGVVSVEGVSDRATLARLAAQLKLAASVEATANRPPGPTNFSQARVAPDGSFRLAGLRPGRARIGFGWPQPRGFTLTRVELNGVEQREGVELAEGASVSNLRVVVAYGTASARGQVNFTNGTPGAGDRLVVFARRIVPGQETPDGAPGRSIEADARGRFLLEGLPAGEYEFTARVFSGRGARPNVARQQVSVPEGAEVSVTLTLDLGTP